ncbi:NPCBM/NEW2 domain-containing protein [Pseudoflavonifractor sp. An85]|uniref:NPCBM/NEW2 domain-containing protein n=1 Tax=Pseudoflavonifractor sp. An85 TaxID=1965661 RepID=UPI0013026631|nr:NPCBM/NEW2 domain-containing protein [Pseudoflavonifractor sp. An85]
MKIRRRTLASGTLVLSGVLAAFGVELYSTLQAQASAPVMDVPLSSLTPTASRCQTFLKDQDSAGNPLTLLQDGQEVRYDTGLLTVPASNSYASLYFIDIQEHGYQSFQADIGLNATVGNTGGEVEFKILADGQQVYSSGTVTHSTEAQHVNIDLTQVEVLQLVVDAKGSNANDMAVWANAHFTKAENAPYLAVDDLEFNQSWQVTPENILEYVTAKDMEGNLSVGGNFKPRHYKWFVFGSQQYDKSLLRYPSVWVELSQDEVLLPAGTTYDLYSYISDFGSIFNQDFAVENIQLTVDKVDQEGNVVKANIGSFPASGSSSDLAAGYYRVTYAIADQGKTNASSLTVRVTGEEADQKHFQDVTSSTGNAGTQAPLGLWDGSAEKWYENGMYINEAGSITFNVEGQNYKYLSFDFGIKNSVRANTAWGSNGKVAAKVAITTTEGTQVIYEGATLGWYTKYEHISLQLPDNTLSVTIYSLNKGAGNNHAGIGGLTFFRDSGRVDTIPEENPPALSETTLEIADTDVFDIYTALQGVDSEDGTFALTSDNFVVDPLPQADGKYVPGTHQLHYQLIDRHGNVTTGVITIVVTETIPEPEPSPEVTPEPSPEVTPEPSPEVTPEPSPEPSTPDQSVVVDTHGVQSNVTLGNAQVVFHGGTVVKVESILSGTIFDRAMSALKDQAHQLAVFEFTALRDGVAVQPSAPVQVVFEIPSHLSADHLKLFYVAQDGSTEAISITVNKKSNTVTANLDHFSTYVLADVTPAQGGEQGPVTGDSHMLPLFVAMLGSASLALCAVVVARKRAKA